MNQHGTNRHEVSQKAGNIDARAWIHLCTRHRIQIMIERNQDRRGKEGFTLGHHGRRVWPDFQFETIPEIRNGILKCSDALFVVFEDQDGFHRVSMECPSSSSVSANWTEKYQWPAITRRSSLCRQFARDKDCAGQRGLAGTPSRVPSAD